MKVILIHGLYMHGMVMQPLSQLLAKRGYETDVISYNSVSIEEDDVFQSIDSLIDPSGPNILIGHSLGGLMIKHYLKARQMTTAQVSHVVAIGSPLQGASIVDAIQALGLGQILATQRITVWKTTAVNGTSRKSWAVLPEPWRLVFDRYSSTVRIRPMEPSPLKRPKSPV